MFAQRAWRKARVGVTPDRLHEQQLAARGVAFADGPCAVEARACRAFARAPGESFVKGEGARVVAGALEARCGPVLGLLAIGGRACAVRCGEPELGRLGVATR